MTEPNTQPGELNEQERETLWIIKEYCKSTIRTFVFEPNDANTWVRMKAMMSAHLTQLWQHGKLAGPTAESSFIVHCGLGSSMTVEDILEGVLRVRVEAAVTHPGQFKQVEAQGQVQSGR